MAPKKRGKEPAVAAAQPAARVDRSIGCTIEVVPSSQDAQGLVAQENRRLITYCEEVPGSETSNAPLHYAAIHGSMSVLHGLGNDPMSQNSRQCIVMKRETIKNAKAIVALLITCEHPNILKPIGVWEEYTKADVTEQLEYEAYITFPLVDGTLSQLPIEELFLVETIQNRSHLQGFTEHGFKTFRQIISAVQYVNERYNNSSGSTSSGSRTTFSLLPLQLGKDRIFYEVCMEEYNVLLGDFFNRNSTDWPEGLSKNPSVKEISIVNWNGVGNYLKSLTESCVRNAELSHLIDTLTDPSMTEDDLLWEPALWDAKMKMRYIREIFWCLESDKTEQRKKLLSRKPSLGLQSCMNRMGLTYTEKDLLGSFTFLRHKILAHADDPYRSYTGPKEDIGLDKATIEKFVLKERPDYMIKLINVIRPMRWIEVSPLAQSGNNYMQQLKIA